MPRRGDGIARFNALFHPLFDDLHGEGTDWSFGRRCHQKFKSIDGFYKRHHFSRSGPLGPSRTASSGMQLQAMHLSADILFYVFAERLLSPCTQSVGRCKRRGGLFFERRPEGPKSAWNAFDETSL